MTVRLEGPWEVVGWVLVTPRTSPLRTTDRRETELFLCGHTPVSRSSRIASALALAARTDAAAGPRRRRALSMLF
ncbi:hypothetical protein EVAR_92810_1 [Eumeta japonica]|uniref:Uncharacterized protein n=1 Tax=Eumeta variegata TaxID=151549 RepID=A0A4C1TAW2_EUMVA|nr:hypothetical protein EVAR_92810_1 [Eumeta japonica]